MFPVVIIVTKDILSPRPLPPAIIPLVVDARAPCFSTVLDPVSSPKSTAFQVEAIVIKSIVFSPLGVDGPDPPA